MSETIADVNGITNTYSAAGVTRSRAYYYDAKGRVIQIRESDSDGHAATYSTSYDFAGNVTATLEKHTSPGNVTHILKTDYTRDARGRVASCSRTFDGNSLADVTYGYDALGRLSGKEGGAGLEETYDYDFHGWQTAMNAKVNSTEVFSQLLNYESPSGQGASPRWSGAISGSLSKHYGNSNYSGENYSYDGAGRFTGMTRYSPPVPGQMITVVQERVERNVEYDANGNIMSLERLMGIRDSHDLAMQYSGNRLVSVTDGNSAPMLYDYDADGNLASDGHTGFEFSYNILNLPMSAEDSADGRTMIYTYLSDGTKLKAVSEGGAGLTYRGSFVYGLSSGGGCTLESVATDEGRIVMDGTAVKDEWHVRDHVGNVRSVVWLNAPAGTSVSASILEQNDYLPFGTRLPGSRTDQSNRYRLAGKEEQDIAGMDLSLLDFGARYYDAYVGRWSAIDPLAHKYFPMSPYNYCGNNPVNFFDPDGRESDPVKNPKIRFNRASNLFGNDVRITKEGATKCHQGFDYEATVGTDVLAVKDGKVVDAGPTRGAYGTVICLEHTMDDNSTKYTFYAHLSEIDVKVGDVVKEGDTIGKTGVTGNASNCKGKDQHLHFEFRTKQHAPKGLDGRINPNEIVPTKFTSQDPSKTPQREVGVVKEDKDGTKTKMDID